MPVSESESRFLETSYALWNGWQEHEPPGDVRCLRVKVTAVLCAYGVRGGKKGDVIPAFFARIAVEHAEPAVGGRCAKRARAVCACLAFTVMKLRS